MNILRCVIFAGWLAASVAPVWVYTEDIALEKRTACATLVTELLTPFQDDYIHALQTGTNYIRKRHFVARSAWQDEADTWYTTLYAVGIKTEDQLRFANGTVKPGVEIRMSQGETARASRCDTGVQKSPQAPVYSSAFEEFDMLAAYMYRTGHKLLRLDDETECEIGHIDTKAWRRIGGSKNPGYGTLIIRRAIVVTPASSSEVESST